MIKYISFYLICVSFFLIAELSGQEKTVSFRIEVIDFETKLKIADANARVAGVLTTTTTEEDGVCVFNVRERTTYRIYVTKEGYVPYEGNIKAIPGELRFSVIQLVKAKNTSFFIRGNLIDGNSQPIINKDMTITIGRFRKTIKSDSVNGDFLIEIPLNLSGPDPEGIIIINFPDCPPAIQYKFRSQPGGQFSDFMIIRKECLTELRGQILSPRNKPLKGSKVYYDSPNSPGKYSGKIDSHNGTFVIDGIPVSTRINIAIENAGYYIKTYTHVVSRSPQNNNLTLEPKKLFFPKIPTKNNTPFYLSSGVSAASLVYSYLKFQKSKNIHKDYEVQTDNNAFINLWPDFANRDDAFTKIEQLRKTSQVFLIGGVVQGLFGLVFLRQSPIAKLSNFSVSNGALSWKFSF